MTDLIPSIDFDTGDHGESQIIHLTFWDLWMAIILSQWFNGNWDLLAAHFRAKAKPGGFERDHAEGLLNHLLHLRTTLETAGLTAADILTRVDPSVLKLNKPKAKRKVLEMQFQRHECSIWMIETPRKQREGRALQGFWDRFPVSPATFADGLAAISKPGKLYEEDESFKLERKLTVFWNDMKSRWTRPVCLLCIGPT
jgi:hypothetical protein